MEFPYFPRGTGNPFSRVVPLDRRGENKGIRAYGICTTRWKQSTSISRKPQKHGENFIKTIKIDESTKTQVGQIILLYLVKEKCPSTLSVKGAATA